MVTLVVNVASHWGKTQLSYDQMSQLQQRFGSKGFSVRK
jgi:glutathione peroxidase-family protein